MSPIAARNAAVATRFTPGTVISRLASGECSICLAISRSTSAISRSRKPICRNADCTVSASLIGSSRERSHLRPLTPNRSEHGGLPCSRRIRTACTSFLVRDRERTSCSRRASRRRNTRQRSSGIHTASSSPRQSSLASARASSLSVLVRACAIPVSSGETTITLCTCGSSSRATSHAPPETSSATRSVESRLAANASSASGVTLTRPAERTTPSSQIAISQKSRCRSRPIPRPTHLNNCDTSHLPSYGNEENQRANDTDRYVLAAQSGQVAGAAKKNSPRSRRIVQNGLPACVLPEGPRPGSPDRTHGAGRSLRARFSCHEYQARPTGLLDSCSARTEAGVRARTTDALASRPERASAAPRRRRPHRDRRSSASFAAASRTRPVQTDHARPSAIRRARFSAAVTSLGLV
jgi:hypothetical protein